MNLEEARAYFAKDRFATEAAGIEILEVGGGNAVCSMKLRECHRNATGQVMGGAIFTLADFTFAVATNSGDCTTVTAVSQISYLGIARGTTLTGRTRILKDGKRSCFYEITVADELGNAVAVISTNGMHLERKGTV